MKITRHQSAIEALRCLPRQWATSELKKAVDSRDIPFDRPHRDHSSVTLTFLPERCLGPCTLGIEFTCIRGWAGGRGSQRQAQPFGHNSCHRISDQSPSTPCPRNLLSRCGPVGLKSLKPLGIADIWRHYASIGHPDRGRRRDSHGGASFKSRHTTRRPTKATVALCPIEPAGRDLRLVGASRTSILTQQNAGWVTMDRGEQEDTLPSLRDTEGPRIDRAIRPLVAQAFKGSHDVFNHGAPVELQHEGYILKECPRRLSLLEHSKDVGNYGRLLAIQSLSSSHL